MNELKTVSNQVLLSETKSLVEKERETTLRLIEHLREIESRMLYAEMGYSSLWSFCVEYLKLSEGSAQRRIQAMRLTKQLPEAKQAIADGDLSVSNAAKLQSFFQNEKKNSKSHSVKEKVQILDSVRNLSQKECEKKLFEISPESVELVQTGIKQISEDQSLLRVTLRSESIEKLNLLKDRLAHVLPGADYSELIEYLIEEKLQKIEEKIKGPKEKKSSKSATKLEETTKTAKLEENSQMGSESTVLNRPNLDPAFGVKLEAPSTAAAAVSTATNTHAKSLTARNYIPIATKRAVWQRAKSKCEFISDAGKRCNSTHKLQIEHDHAKAIGGSDELWNLKLYCRNHNVYQAQLVFGKEVMGKYIRAES